MTSYNHFTALHFVCLLLRKICELSVNGKTNELSKNERQKTDGCWHSSTGVSPRPILVGAARNALWAFNARVSLTCPVCHGPQTATSVLRSVFIARSQGRSWRTGRMARYRTERIRLPYTAPAASRRAFFAKVRQASCRTVGTVKGRRSLSQRF